MGSITEVRGTCLGYLSFAIPKLLATRLGKKEIARIVETALFPIRSRPMKIAGLNRKLGVAEHLEKEHFYYNFNSYGETCFSHSVPVRL